LFDYDKYRREEFEKLKVSEEVKKDWENNFGSDEAKFNSDSVQYKNYILKNDYYNFLEIDVLKVSEEMVWFSRYTKVNLLVKPKNGVGIRKLSGYVHFLEKNEELDSLSNFSIVHKKKAYFSFSGYTKKEFNISASHYQNDLTSIEDLPAEIIKQKYKIRFRVNELVIDDGYVDVKFDSVPNTMKEVFIGKYPYYKSHYIKENINSNFKEFIFFVSDSASQLASKKFLLESDFYKTGSEKYYEIKIKQLE